MDILTFIAKSIEYLAWPVSAIVICIILKSPIEKLLGRLNKAKHKDTELEFNSDIQRSASTIVKSSNIADAIPQDNLGLIAEAEQRIYDSLKQLGIVSDAEKIKVLAKHHANLQINSNYSLINSLIFGSQIELLQALNVQASPVEVEFLFSFYEAAKKEYPEAYANNTFENYINFIKSFGLINMENGKYFITVLGRGFLTYLAENGINTKRVF